MGLRRTVVLCRFPSLSRPPTRPHGGSATPKRGAGAVGLAVGLTVGPAVGLCGSLWYFGVDRRERRRLRLLLDGVGRFARSVGVGVRISIDYWWTENVELRGVPEESPRFASAMSRCHVRAAERLTGAALRNGGLYVKLGQSLCAFDHLLPPEYPRSLRRLEDRALSRGRHEGPGSYFGVPSCILGSPRWFLGSLCCILGFPLVFWGSHIDFWGSHVGYWGPHVHFGLSHVAFGVSHVAFGFHMCILGSPVCILGSPRVYFGVPFPRVYFGVPPRCFLGSPQAATKLIRLFAEQIFSTGFIHADPHPGNVLVRRGADGKAELILLDHGLYEELSQRDREWLCRLWRAMVLRDESGVRSCARQIGVHEPLLLCEMLLQRPLWGAGALSDALSREERSYMRAMARRRFAAVAAVLRALPTPLLLVCRNINTVRSVHAALGAPVDRYGLMARSAVRSWGRGSGGGGGAFGRWLRATWESLRFEVALSLDRLSVRLTSAALRLLSRWGVLPHGDVLDRHLRA
ncbi:uncharacterized aarF domain-containing protein kinase 5 [Cuculus canorus]|uniref:uncharacterized aarF domain-containing protein kinase 5 n=1 Tax=Cuculus canorus TaxID=55661 RepID=UPI0023AAD894|nr:uncharacterized aarF domain-containing protein kinase 5 [Cuculus canorus]